MGQKMQTTDIHISSKFALLDVTRGYKELCKRIKRVRGTDKSRAHDLTPPLPVLIMGNVTHRHGEFDGVSQEFGVEVERVVTGHLTVYLGVEWTCGMSGCEPNVYKLFSTEEDAKRWFLADTINRITHKMVLNGEEYVV